MGRIREDNKLTNNKKRKTLPLSTALAFIILVAWVYFVVFSPLVAE